MKKYIFILITLLIASCSSDSKEFSKKRYSILDSENIVEFTSYKYTDKTPVSGRFNKLTIMSQSKGSTIREAINGAEFEIPVSSVFTEDGMRDYRIENLFFGAMIATINIEGSINLVDDSKGIIKLKMNDVIKEVNFNYTIEETVFKMYANIDVLNWNAQNAITRLNEECKDVHKGSDGIVKLWSKVDVEARCIFK